MMPHHRRASTGRLLPRIARAISSASLAVSSLLLSSCVEMRPTDFAQLEHSWVVALQTHDTAALDKLLDDSFVDSTFRGEIRHKDDVLAGPSAAGPYHSIRLDDIVVRQYGNDTTVVNGVNVLQGASESDVVRIRFTDVFVRSNGRWRAVSAQETLQAPSTKPA